MPYCRRKGLKRSAGFSPANVRRASTSKVSISSRMAGGIGFVTICGMVRDLTWFIDRSPYSSGEEPCVSDVVHGIALRINRPQTHRQMFDRNVFENFPFRLLNLFPNIT